MRSKREAIEALESIVRGLDSLTQYVLDMIDDWEDGSEADTTTEQDA